MSRKIHFLLLLLLAGCATAQGQQGYVGLPIAAPVEKLGPPIKVADDQSAGRYFVWALSDMIVVDEQAANTANWLDPTTRTNAPERTAEQKLTALPDSIVSPPFRPGSCTFSLIAKWDARARTWVATRAVRKDAPAGGHCGMRIETR